LSGFSFFYLEVEDGLGSGSSVSVIWNELDLASSGWDIDGSVSVSSSRDHLFGSLSGVGWACDEELDVLVFVGSVCPSADDGGGSSSARNVSDSVELVVGGGD